MRTVIEGDTPHPSGDDRYAIYSVCVEPRMRRRIAETSLAHIGSTITTLREEGQLSPASRIGVLDRLDRTRATPRQPREPGTRRAHDSELARRPQVPTVG